MWTHAFVLLMIVFIGAVTGSMESFQDQTSMINNGGTQRGRRPIKFVPTPFPVAGGASPMDHSNGTPFIQPMIM